jgi:hypothetical protein
MSEHPPFGPLSPRNTAEAEPPFSALEERVHALLGSPERPRHIDLRLRFGRHHTAEDVAEEEVRNADIVLMEGRGFEESHQKFMNAVTRGEIGEDKVALVVGDKSAFNKKEASLLWGSGKSAYYLDIPKEDPEYKKVDEAFAKFYAAERSLFTHTPPLSFDEALNEYAVALDGYADAVRLREEKITNRLAETLARAIRENPRLKEGKEAIRVYAQYGALHSGIADRVKSDHPAVQTDRSAESAIDSFKDEWIRLRIHGKPVPKELKEQAFFAEMLHRFGYKKPPAQATNAEIARHGREAVASFSSESLREFYVAAVQRRDSAHAKQTLLASRDRARDSSDEDT